MLLDLLLRWMHIFSAIALAGGTFFLAWVWAPATASATADEREQWFLRFRKPWSMLVMISTLFLLISGLVNAVTNIKRYELPGTYHGLVAVKLLVALVMFFLAARIAGRSDGAVRLRQQMGKWLHAAAILAVLLIGMGGYMKCLEHVPKATTEGGEIEMTASAAQ